MTMRGLKPNIPLIPPPPPRRHLAVATVTKQAVALNRNRAPLLDAY